MAFPNLLALKSAASFPLSRSSMMMNPDVSSIAYSNDNTIMPFTAKSSSREEKRRVLLVVAVSEAETPPKN